MVSQGRRRQRQRQRQRRHRHRHRRVVGKTLWPQQDPLLTMLQRRLYLRLQRRLETAVLWL